MPTYVYECRACHREFEVEQRIVEDALTDCDKCGAKGSLRRIIQPVGVAFKGAGFHINDYGPKPASESAGSSAEATKPSESKETATEPAKAAEPAKSAEPKPTASADS